MIRVLVVDDEPSVNTLIKEYLRLSGHEPVVCCDGESALALLKDDSGFDVIILDKRLPGMSGADAFKAIKADPRLRSIPVIVLSASVQPGALKDDIAAADLHMAKPFTPKELAGAVARLAKKT